MTSADESIISMRVNGNLVQLVERPGEMLSDLLRYRLGLTGTKIGCNESECGACTVLVNGRPVLSCSFPAKRAEGCDVITIEGLAIKGKSMDVKVLHPLQEAFIRYGAVQCGFCIPGQIMTAYGLLKESPDPSEEHIKSALKDTLCRCGGYSAIIQAIQAAATSIRTGNPVESPVIEESHNP